MNGLPFCIESFFDLGQRSAGNRIDTARLCATGFVIEGSPVCEASAQSAYSFELVDALACVRQSE
jgi:hypothetical protein